jgi:hypothetical protein
MYIFLSPIPSRFNHSIGTGICTLWTYICTLHT